METLLDEPIRSRKKEPASCYIGEFTQQDGRKKRTAKRFCATNVTGLLLACFAEIFN